MYNLTLTIIILVLVVEVHGYASGAGENACSNGMVPDHGGSNVTGDLPNEFQFTADDYYNTEENHTVTSKCINVFLLGRLLFISGSSSFYCILLILIMPDVQVM